MHDQTAAVLREFGLPMCDRGATCDHYDCTGERAMAAEVVQLRAALAEARERERDGLTLHAQNLQSLVDKRTSECNRLNAQFTALTSDAAVEAAAKELYLTGDLSAFETWEQQIPRYKQTYYDDARSILTAARAAATGVQP